ncbi:MAG: NAD-dependent epimerase/dehydratase family protein [Gemmataceae bacterium]
MTGAAGFIGSHLCDRLLADGHEVVGVDCFTDYYARPIKEHNLDLARGHRRFEFQELDLASGVPASVVDGVDAVYHLAAMPGLIRSWTHFDDYNRCNFTATHRLLESLRGSKTLKKLVYASTSSVYGKEAFGNESLPVVPSSPYGITKLAGEQLCRIFGTEFGLPFIILRFFSVYGPRQRPDMGYTIFIDKLLKGQPLPLTGDGSHIRGNTFIDDCVEALTRSLSCPNGETYNLGGGELVTVNEVIAKLEQILGIKAQIDRKPPRPGDQLKTGADCSKLSAATGWQPVVSVLDGLRRQVEYQKSLNRLTT